MAAFGDMVLTDDDNAVEKVSRSIYTALRGYTHKLKM